VNILIKKANIVLLGYRIGRNKNICGLASKSLLENFKEQMTEIYPKGVVGRWKEVNILKF
jgi:hypothetical protein